MKLLLVLLFFGFVLSDTIEYWVKKKVEYWKGLTSKDIERFSVTTYGTKKERAESATDTYGD